MKRGLFFLTISILMFSCNDTDITIRDFKYNLVRSGYNKHYDDYGLRPMHREANIIVVEVSDSGEYFISKFDPNNISRLKLSRWLKPTDSYQIIDDLETRKRIFDFLLRSYDLGILEFKVIEGINIIHTNVPVKDNGKSENYKYVLIQSYKGKQEIISVLEKYPYWYDYNGELIEIDNDWYFYKSTTYSKYNKLTDLL